MMDHHNVNQKQGMGKTPSSSHNVQKENPQVGYIKTKNSPPNRLRLYPIWGSSVLAESTVILLKPFSSRVHSATKHFVWFKFIKIVGSGF